MGDERGAQFGWKRAAKAGLSFRPAIDKGDMQTIGLIYASVHKERMVDLPLSDAQKAWFVLTHFRAQEAWFRENYPEADWLLIEHRDCDIGRLYLDCDGDDHFLLDITLLPSCRGKGVGGAVLRDVLDEAASVGHAVVAEVGKGTRAMNLFKRLGFKCEEDLGDNDLMRWTA